MENCVAPGLDKFQSIIRSCIVFGQTNFFNKYSLLKINVLTFSCTMVAMAVNLYVRRWSPMAFLYLVRV